MAAWATTVSFGSLVRTRAVKDRVLLDRLSWGRMPELLEFVPFNAYSVNACTPSPLTSESEETRISLSFNTFLVGKLGEEQDLTALELL